MKRTTGSRTGLFRIAGSGIAIALLYAVVAWLTFGSGVRPVRPFFDGVHTPNPYRWVNPPKDAATKLKPAKGTASFHLGAKANDEGGGLATDDGQAQVLVPEGAFASAPGQKSVTVTATPLDPATIGDPPEQTVFNGNAYRIDAVYEPSGEPARPTVGDTCPEASPTKPTTCVSVVLLYPYKLNGIELYRRSADDWTPIIAQDSPASYSVFGDSPRMGIFVVTGFPSPGASRTGDYVAIALGVLAVATGIAFEATRKERKRKEAIARARGKKMKKPR